MALHMVTGQVVWEASASLAIGALLVYVAFRLGRDARDQLIGEAADPEASGRIQALLRAQPEIDSVEALFTMKTGLDSALVAARVDLVPGLDSEQVEEVAVRIKRSIARTVPEARPDLPRRHGPPRRKRQQKAPPRRGNAAGPEPRVPRPRRFMRTGQNFSAGGFSRGGPGGSALRHPPSAGSSTNTGISRSVFFW